MCVEYKLVGKRIKQIRVKTGLTQEDLAEKAKISVSHLSNIETSNTKLSLPALVRICNALQVSTDTLLYESIEKYEYPFNNIFLINMKSVHSIKKI